VRGDVKQTNVRRINTRARIFHGQSAYHYTSCSNTSMHSCITTSRYFYLEMRIAQWYLRETWIIRVVAKCHKAAASSGRRGSGVLTVLQVD
jgi:ribosomal protein L20